MTSTFLLFAIPGHFAGPLELFIAETLSIVPSLTSRKIRLVYLLSL